GSEPSSILGALNANGQIFLINPNGILFGEGARVDVGGLIASSLEFDDNDFLSGDLDYLSFAADGVSPGIVAVSSGALLTAEHGYIVLIAPMVTNGGTLSAPRGS